MGYMKRREKRESEQRATIRAVLMQFRWANTHWRVTFRPRGDTIALPRVLHFHDAEKLRDLYRRFGTRHLSEDEAALEFAIRSRRGAVELMLGREQLSKLQQLRRAPPWIRILLNRQF